MSFQRNLETYSKYLMIIHSVSLNIADVTALFANIVFSDKDKILIKTLYQLKVYKATELMSEFTNK